SHQCVCVPQVSDQKPLGSWTVKQGQSVACPAVCNGQTGEYVVVSDHKVLRVWKDDDISFDKVFKATLSADVQRLHAVPDAEALVLFKRGAVRQLDTLLAAPQQPIEEVLSEDEVIRWSSSFVDGDQPGLLFVTEQNGDHFLYLQKLQPNVLHKYRMEAEGNGANPLSFAARLQDKNIRVTCLYSSGCVFETLLALSPVLGEGVPTLPRSLLLRLPVEEGVVPASASLLFLDDAHVAVVGAPHPSAQAGKDFLCIWNLNFQTLQAAKELPGGVHGQLWSHAARLYVSHGKALTVVPYECEASSLAAAVGKLRPAGPTGGESRGRVGGSCVVVVVPEGDCLVVPTEKMSRKSQALPALTVDQVLERIQSVSQEELQQDLGLFLSRAGEPELQLSVGQITTGLVRRCLQEPTFYPQSTLVQLVQTGRLCHSVCPDFLMLALSKKDYFLTQLCLQLFPDIPEAVTCACLKAFLSVMDADLEAVSVDLGSVSFMTDQPPPTGPGGGAAELQNGFSPALLDEDSCDVQTPTLGQSPVEPDLPCPVGPKKAALLNEILQTAHSENFLLPPLKDLSAQQVILLLQYLQFLYVRCSQDVNTQLPGLRTPTISQILDWVCLLLDAHFTVLILVPEAKGLLANLHRFVRSQVVYIFLSSFI
ncbi:NOL11 protein, partial [Amia calva]|nr:NOL11 protein [Amia calva]